MTRLIYASAMNLGMLREITRDLPDSTEIDFEVREPLAVTAGNAYLVELELLRHRREPGRQMILFTLGPHNAEDGA